VADSFIRIICNFSLKCGEAGLWIRPFGMTFEPRGEIRWHIPKFRGKFSKFCSKLNGLNTVFLTFREIFRYFQRIAIETNA